MKRDFDLRATLDELRGLDMENVGSWPRFAQVGAAVIACLVVVIAGYWFFISADLSNLKQARHREARLREQFRIKQHKVANLAAYEKQLQEMKRDFGRMLQQLPSQGEVANLLNDISQTRAASGLSEQLFKPQVEVHKNFYAELPNQIKVTGTYQQLATFVSGVAALPRIVTVHQVHIQPVNGKQSAQNVNKQSTGRMLSMSAVLTTYRYMKEGEQSKTKKRGKR